MGFVLDFVLITAFKINNTHFKWDVKLIEIGFSRCLKPLITKCNLNITNTFKKWCNCTKLLNGLTYPLFLYSQLWGIIYYRQEWNMFSKRIFETYTCICVYNILALVFISCGAGPTFCFRCTLLFEIQNRIYPQGTVYSE